MRQHLSHPFLHFDQLPPEDTFQFATRRKREVAKMANVLIRQIASSDIHRLFDDYRRTEYLLPTFSFRVSPISRNNVDSSEIDDVFEASNELGGRVLILRMAFQFVVLHRREGGDMRTPQ
jgi:hypothetical protein